MTRSKTAPRMLGAALLSLILTAAPTRAQDDAPSWKFAHDYTAEQLMRSPEAAACFARQMADGEAAFFAAARDPESGLTFDGWDLDPVTRQPFKARRFSAASKECLDLALLTKALYRDPLISRVVSPMDPEKAPEVAVGILGKKIASYERYRDKYPGFNGYMAWFTSGTDAAPMKGWETAFPTLDLGEMIWALLLTERALEQTGHQELGARYETFNQHLQERAREAMFNEAKGGVRGRVEVADPLSSETTYSSDALMTGEHGVHEGQMIVLYMSLYGDLTPAEVTKVWKNISMKRVEHPDGTTWQGFWGSPHEEWAYLFLPYRDLPEYRQLFRIREKIRAANAARRGYPGFGASAHHPLGKGYMSAAGIEEIGSQPLEHQDTYTPYGAFPVLLEFAGRDQGNVGLVWLHNMLLGPGMQGPFGAGESGDNAGTGSASIKTIDATFTTLLAMSGGLEKEMAELLKADGKYEAFLDIMRGEYQETFAKAPLREPLQEFSLPLRPAGTGPLSAPAP